MLYLQYCIAVLFRVLYSLFESVVLHIAYSAFGMNIFKFFRLLV
ncbi:hypothetical protein Barb4_03356 [Bacteroidales bacterium Barb4]|nr:hypothetical protein Barb4_03356 [Bacteroidales bacterium Barb4]